MLNFTIEPKYLITSSGSFGAQVKYLKDNVYYKVDSVGNEGVSERLCSILLDCTDVPHVKYEECYINNKHGCISENFMGSNDMLMTLSKLYMLKEGAEIETVLRTLSFVKDRYNFVINFVKGAISLDVTEYLDALLCLDFITLNPDRHCDNIAFTYDGTNWNVAPIFDNGQALGANWSITPPGYFDEKKLFARTLSGSFNDQLLVTSTKLKINYTAVYDLLERERDTRNKSLLKQRLLEYERLFRYC